MSTVENSLRHTGHGSTNLRNLKKPRYLRLVFGEGKRGYANVIACRKVHPGRPQLSDTIVITYEILSDSNQTVEHSVLLVKGQPARPRQQPREQLKQLDEHLNKRGHYCFTVNGFPVGPS